MPQYTPIKTSRLIIPGQEVLTALQRTWDKCVSGEIKSPESACFEISMQLGLAEDFKDYNPPITVKPKHEVIY